MADNIVDVGTTPVWRLDKNNRINWREKPRSDFDLSRTLLQFEGSTTQMVVITEDLPAKLEFAVTIRDKASEKQFIDEFVARKGQWGKFWFPLPSNRFTLHTSQAQNSSVLVFKKNEWKYLGYERIYLKMNNGDLITRKVTAVSVDEIAGTQTLTLATVTDRLIDPASVLICSFLLLCRLEQDLLEMDFISATASETKIKLVELVREYDDV